MIGLMERSGDTERMVGLRVGVMESGAFTCVGIQASYDTERIPVVGEVAGVDMVLVLGLDNLVFRR